MIAASGTGLAVAPALRVLTWPLLALAIILLSRGWYLQLAHGWNLGSSVRKKAFATLAVSTVLAGLLWGLRFAGVLGERPF